MNYRLATESDLPHCDALLASLDYYDPVRLSDLGGLVIVAEDGTQGLVGCVWLGVTGKRAYLDYLGAVPGHSGVGVRLLSAARGLLREGGVREVIFSVHKDNITAARLAGAFGSDEPSLHLLYRAEIGVRNGQEED